MLFNYFAGAIFTTQEVVTFCLVAFVMICVFAGLIIYVGKKLLNKTQGQGAKSKPSLGSALLIGSGFVGTIILLFFVVPTLIKDNNWNRNRNRA